MAFLNLEQLILIVSYVFIDILSFKIAYIVSKTEEHSYSPVYRNKENNTVLFIKTKLYNYL